MMINSMCTSHGNILFSIGATCDNYHMHVGIIIIDTIKFKNDDIAIYS